MNKKHLFWKISTFVLIIFCASLVILNETKTSNEIDFPFRLAKNLRTLFINTLRTYLVTGKIKPSCEYGIDYKAIIEHLKPFPKDIENYHIDHIIPLSLFDFNNPQQIKIAFAPTNHQWLTIKENLEKGNRLVMPHQILT